MSIQLVFKNKKFSPLMWTQFFGALNDNILKNSLVVLLAFRGIELWGLHSESLISLATLVFIVPFFLFSALAGQVSDKFEKSQLIRWIKLAEIGIMVLSGIGFYLANYALVFLALFLMGLHSAFFGPLKYSILPELLDEEQLTSGNAFIEVGTFMAILIGTLAGGHLVSILGGEMYIIAFLILNSIFGFLLSLKVPEVPRANPDLKIQYNPIPQTISTIRVAHKTKSVFNSILGISWFWFLGAVILSLLPTITKQILNSNEHVVTLFLGVFTVGIALGALICEKLSFERIEIGLVPWGSLGMTLFLLDLSACLFHWTTPSQVANLEMFFAAPNAIRLVVDLFVIAISGGLFTVPLYTLIQQRSERKVRSQVIGANNIVNSLFMVIGSLLLILFLNLKIEIPTIIVIYAVFNLLIAIYIYTLVPEFTLRFLSWVLVNLMYRVKLKGAQNLPKEGAGILICNHVSFVDWLVISGLIKRPLRYVMYYKFTDLPLGKYLIRHAGVVPIAGQSENPEIFKAAFEKMSEYLKAGELICLFPEGAITKDGQIQSFKKGIEFVLAKDPVPVYPMALNGLWGSMFSHFGSKAFTKLPKRFWNSVQLNIGEKIPAGDAKIEILESRVRALHTRD